MPWDPEFEAAIKKGDVAQVNKLMDKGADANARREQDYHTPLSYAVTINAGRLVEAMVGHPNFKYTNDTTIAVLCAVTCGHPEFLPFLLKKHTDENYSLDAWNDGAKTACWHADEKGYTTAVALLTEHGADPKPTTIPEGDLQITDQKIGNGHYGTVYLGALKSRNIAVKKYSDKSVGIPETMFMSKLKHPNIVALYGITETPTALNLVMEYMDNGNLEQYLKNHPRKNETDLLTVYRILLDVAQAVTYLHENRSIHFDIRGPNILLNQQLSAKLCDFNTSRKLPPNNDVFHYKVEKKVQEPNEVEKKARDLTRAYDILCLGLVLNMVTTEARFNESGRFVYPRDYFNLIVDTAGSHRPVPSIHTSTNVVSLIKWCIKEEPTARPSATEVVDGLKAVIR